MAYSYDIRSLVGLTFGSVVDEIAPGWDGQLGFNQNGPRIVGMLNVVLLDAGAMARRAEIRQAVALIVAELRERKVLLVDADGVVVPLSVWHSGLWVLHRIEAAGVEWLEVVTGAGDRIRYYSPCFRLPAVEQSAEDDGWVPPAGSKAQKVRAALERYGPRLPDLGSDERQADFIRRKAGCSLTYAKDIMKVEKKGK